jgi:hypothetical protein
VFEYKIMDWCKGIKKSQMLGRLFSPNRFISPADFIDEGPFGETVGDFALLIWTPHCLALLVLIQLSFQFIVLFLLLLVFLLESLEVLLQDVVFPLQLLVLL